MSDLPRPVKTIRTTIGKLSESLQNCVNSASDCLEVHSSDKVRIETYYTKDIQKLFSNLFKWSTTLKEMKLKIEAGRVYADDIKRVRKIIRKIRHEGAWPYVSYWADDMEELFTVVEDTEICVPNHGDGWHRLIANVELKSPTFDILFLE
jgi:hypothetical protein